MVPREASERERQSAARDLTIFDLSGGLMAAIAQRDRLVWQCQVVESQISTKIRSSVQFLYI
ncbi:hypothetical protein HH212_26965 (plasmid) [Massilia forsythiae]|uniref:Uncharacterized protein n=1 Tax=Massilia forsythiae TaxID=2728020 RepID=A0A7Z2W2L8_9BURK|nr:hypothetical protein [Massilia forsythiae]QJE03739.1 hypothetical protein HH212_26965 [Massilia forsythiae]